MLLYVVSLFSYCTWSTGSPIRYRWMQNDTWSPCSVGCGQGESNAIFNCYDSSTSNAVFDILCKEKRPVVKKECFEKPCINSVGSKGDKTYAVHYDDILASQFQDVEFDSKPYSGFEHINQRLYDSIYDKPYTGFEKMDLKPFDDIQAINNKQNTDLENRNRDLENTQYDSNNAIDGSYDRQYDDLVNVKRTNYEGPVYTNYRNDNTKNKQRDSQYSGHWFIGEWGQCSVTCGRGAMSRQYACVNRDNTAILADNECPGDKPKSYKICDMKKCIEVFTWYVGKWSKCPNECEGKRRRKVFCTSIEGRKVDDFFCKNSGEKPESFVTCGRPCVRWVSGKWRECKFKRARSCREAVQTRCVICIHEKTYQFSNKCDHTKKPIRKRSCSKHACAKQI